MSVLSHLLGGLGRERGGIKFQAGASMADPDDVFAAGNALVLQRNLLERIDRLRESLPEESAIHVLVGKSRRKVIERVEQTGAAARVALEHVERFISHHEHLGGEVSCCGCARRNLRIE